MDESAGTSSSAPRRQVQGAIVEVSDLRKQGRGLHLESFNSRALLQHEIHELILTTEPGAGKGSTVDRVTYIGFFEVLLGGMARIGDVVVTGDRLDTELGVLAGFDLTHAPNHYNLVLSSERDVTGIDLDLRVGTPLGFRHA